MRAKLRLEQPCIKVMAKQIHSVVNEIKRRIISGQYQPGERLLELPLVEDLGVSRTPIRLAFEELAKDGLLERLPTRGFRVKSFDAKEVSDAIEVRGMLEGMAARLAAEKGVDSQSMQVLYSCLEEGGELLAEAAKAGNELDARQWMVTNARFHTTLIQAAGSAPLEGAIDFISKIPMAAATSLIIEGVAPQLEYEFIARAHHDHCDLVAAIELREGMRAEFIMREHARKTRDNKKRLLASPAMHVR
ncbi:MAG: GntR family transcriptional regulator [Polaromonas sp.]|nr:GntR family transcriptional regulator [Polaromonas sp.]